MTHRDLWTLLLAIVAVAVVAFTLGVAVGVEIRP